jgi:predicted GNAT family acetyltransferase
MEDNQSRKRFELEVDGHVAFLTYRREDDGLELIHTEVPDELEGKGVGSRLVKEVLAFARENSLRVTPTCKFVRSYLERHSDEQDVLAKPL